jgi:hypothetical protein
MATVNTSAVSGGKNVSEFSEINALFERVDKKNPAKEDLTKLRETLAKYPMLSSIGGDLAGQVERHIIDNALPAQLGARISLQKYCEHQRDELGYKSSSPLERSLIQHAVLCWLRLHVCEIRYESAIQSDLTFAQATFWEKKLSTHQGRYLRAVETLARIRKLNLTVQINIGDKQLITGN